MKALRNNSGSLSTLILLKFSKRFFTKEILGILLRKREKRYLIPHPKY